MKPRYRFAEFTLSPSRRQLLRGGKEMALIPRYFDLLVLLIERRNEAIPRSDIFDKVWSDVVVSDGALSQAIRSLRRALGDNVREPVFIRTVSRHGYRFVFPDVIVEDDETCLTPPGESPPDVLEQQDDDKDMECEAAVERLLEPGLAPEKDQEMIRREAAETLHTLGTEEALRRLDLRPGHETARAYLRDSRWDVPGAGPVPLLGQPGSLTTIRTLVLLRFRRANRLAGSRWAAASAGGSVAGLCSGLLGGLVLRFGPGSSASDAVLVALPMVGFIIGGLAASGVGAGLAAAEALVRSFRGPALALFGALGGGTVGASAHLIGRLTLEGLFGGDLSPVAGGFEGLVIGGAVGLGYALSTRRTESGMASPRGKARFMAAGAAGLASAGAGMILAWTGRHLGAMSLDFMAQTFPGSQVGLGPLAHLLGEGEPGPVTRVVISTWEGLLFGFGLILGLTRRPR